MAESTSADDAAIAWATMSDGQAGFMESIDGLPFE
jgi:hypothetical protein